MGALRVYSQPFRLSILRFVLSIVLLFLLLLKNDRERTASGVAETAIRRACSPPSAERPIVRMMTGPEPMLDENDADDIRFFYWDLGMSTGSVAEEFGVSQNTMIKTMDRLGIERRDSGGVVPDSDVPWRDAALLEKMYTGDDSKDMMSQDAIADELGCSASTVRRWMKKHGIETRDPDWRQR